MTTVLELVNLACAEMALPQVTTLIGVTDQPTLRLRAALIGTARELRSTRIYPQQKKTYSFSLTENQPTYPLPQDFYSQVLKTQFNVTTQRYLYQISDAEFVDRLYGIVITTGDVCYRIFGNNANPNYSVSGQFWVSPTPSSSTEDLYFEYITKNLFVPKYWVPETSYAQGVYVSSSDSIWQANNSGTSGNSEAPPSGDEEFLDNDIEWGLHLAPYETPLADTDLCLFDDDPMISGIRYRYLESTNQDYSNALALFNTAKDAAASRYLTPSLGSFSRRGFRPRYTVPYGSWGI